MKRYAVLLVPALIAVMLSGNVAHAAVETPVGFPMTDALGWWRFSENGGTAQVRAVDGVPAIYGTKSLVLRAGPNNVNGTGGQIVVSTDLGVLPGITKLSDLQTLNYATYAFQEPRSTAATIQLSVDLDGGLPNWDTNLVYVPSNNGVVVRGVWQFWRTLNGVWYSTRPIDIAPQGAPATLTAILAEYPDAVVSLIPSDPGGSLRIQYGSSGGDAWGSRTVVDHIVVQAAPLPLVVMKFEGLLPHI
jgi:hypothetical protein